MNALKNYLIKSNHLAKSIFIFIITLSLIFSQSLELKPQFSYAYNSDSEKYISLDALIQEYELGLLSVYQYKNYLKIKSYLGYHLINGMDENLSDFFSTKSLDYINRDPGLSNKQKNYYLSDMQIKYGNKRFVAYLEKWKKSWGPGIHSVLLSDKAPNFPKIGFLWSITDNIFIEYFHGQLKSMLNDERLDTYYSFDGYSKSFDIQRNIVGHRLQLILNKFWNFNISEVAIYANRSFDFAYCMPFLPFFPIQNYLNDTDNILMSFDVQYLPDESKQFYLLLLMDEWSPKYTFDKDNHNWFAWQGGIEINNVIFRQDKIRIEYTWVDHRVYHHRFYVNDYYSWGYPVGFWGGPHSEELFMDYSVDWKNNIFQLYFSYVRRGEYTDDMRADQYSRPSEAPIYKRFSGTIESKKIIGLHWKYSINKNMYIKTQYQHIIWDNAGFNPTVPIAGNELPDITKNSIGIAMLYTF